jgi:hypothetical protein
MVARLWARIAILAVTLTIVSGVIAFVRQIPRKQSPQEVVADLSLVKRYTGLDIPTDSRLREGVYSRQWHGYLICRISLTQQGAKMMLHQLRKRGMLVNRERAFFTSTAPLHLLREHDVLSARDFVVATGGYGGGSLRIFINRDNSIHPTLYICWLD